ncbi:cytochrome P450 [Streptomyces sp. NA04227]|uniref:cytochrome P450 n=1 Tax=Streptomyces sp. NA04227 TaxID=2742136 RepID=UPI000A2071B4|nr:cytochrome P450 [Streptomyces sp. NA04227]ARM20265.1 SauP2 [Streptomyces sp.]QKW07491.1 cytochrome P450 [Streptomyces sp. NA04227]
MSQTHSAPEVPADGPAPGGVSFDPTDPGLQQNPYPAYAFLRENLPVMRGPLGVWMVSRYEDCEALLRDRRMGKDFANSKFFEQIMGSSEELPPFLGFGLDDFDAKMFLLTDPPEHTKLRGLVSQAFTPAIINAMRPRIASIVDELLGELPAEFDLMERLATPMPIRVLGSMLGIPEADQEQFTSWSVQIAGMLDLDVELPPEVAATRRAATGACTTYFLELAERRAAEGGQGEDLISHLVRARDEGSALSTQEIAATCVLLVVAAQETFSNLIGNSGMVFARHPEAFTGLAADPDSIDGVINEIMRLEPPAHQVGRIALEKFDLHGEVFEPGDAVILLVAAANRDERAFPEPDTFRADRDGRPNLSFGRGIHYCLGAPLANLMAREALTGLTRRITSVQLTQETIDFKPGLGLRGPAKLPVRVERRGS